MQLLEEEEEEEEEEELIIYAILLISVDDLVYASNLMRRFVFWVYSFVNKLLPIAGVGHE
jgi:hypothetical protein